jgi:S1-C subfamily serine protease
MLLPALRRAGASLALVLLLTAEAVGAAPSILPVASIQQLVQVGPDAFRWQTVCTAFSIDEKRGLFMTAAHCLPEVTGQLTLDGHVAWVVYQNADLDLAVLESRGAVRPAMVPCVANAALGDEVIAIGHAYGFPVAQARRGHVAAPYMELPIAQGSAESKWFMVVDFALIGGMSGGPMISLDGCVVAINQQGNDAIGLGKPIEVIMAATRQFWTRP